MTNGTRKGRKVSVTPRSLFTPGKDQVTILQEAGWAPGPVWTVEENLGPPPGFDPRTAHPVASRNNIGNIHINVTLSSVRVTIVATDEQ
jgi:hypothetical protein